MAVLPAKSANGGAGMTLEASLDHVPVPLRFGTSGRRGLLIHLTPLEVYINATAELEYLKQLPTEAGGIRARDRFFVAADLRPSSTRMDQNGCGEIAQTILCAVADADLLPVYLGTIPTPALTLYALGQGKGSIMVTGSHIPFDRNGYKTNTALGELMKHHEEPISEWVHRVRHRLYSQPANISPFGPDGRFKKAQQPLPFADDSATEAYVARYVEFFGESALEGLHLLVYQHSAVGRDILPRILRSLGARVTEAGRSETFVPIDTENVDQGLMDSMQRLIKAVCRTEGPLDALVSTDGDSDRPLVLAIERNTQRAQFVSGDLLGILTARWLKPDAVVVPISCNDAIDRSDLQWLVEPKTAIGSPFVIQGMMGAIEKRKQRVLGFEANGGFLTATPFFREEASLRALPTRDAVLPIAAVLTAAREASKALLELVADLPPRYSRAALLRDFDRAKSHRILEALTRPLKGHEGVIFEGDRVFLDNGQLPSDPEGLLALRDRLIQFFKVSDGFSSIHRLNATDGLRIQFTNGDVAHLRASGNADEFRIYAVADHQARADTIAALGVAEPEGILRHLEREYLS